MDSSIKYIHLTVNPSETQNIADSSGNYLYADSWSCYLFGTYNDKIRIDLIYDNIWVAQNFTKEIKHFKICAIRNSSGLKLIQEHLQPNEIKSLCDIHGTHFNKDEWVCFILGNNSVHLYTDDNIWKISNTHLHKYLIEINILLLNTNICSRGY